MKNIFYKSKKLTSGITLIALVITIIVLLILAGVSIATLAGEDGLLSKAMNASERTKIAKAKEEIELAIAEEQINAKTGENLGNKFKYENVWNALREKDSKIIVTENTGEKSYIITYKGYKFKIDENKKVTYIGEGEVIPGETEYKITYNKNDGSNEKLEVIVENGTTVVLETTIFTRGGYNLEGWYLDSGCTGTKITETNSTIEIYAKWEEKTTIESEGSTTIGDITYTESYGIWNSAQFKDLRNKVNAGNTFSNCIIKQSTDIDLNSENWTPIGNYNQDTSLCFEGVYDGQNYKVNNLYINNSDSYQGLFGSVKNGSISNLTVNGSITANTINGGIIAIIRNSDKYSVNNCTNNVNVKNTLEGGAGGIVGHIRDNAINTNINKCTNKGDIQVTKIGAYSAGGIVGTVRDGGSCTITECTNEGTVTCSTVGAGGIIARITNNASDVSIIGCNNIGNAIAERQSGGIIGCIDENTVSNTNISIENCRNSGNINSTLNSAGGMVGFIKDTKRLSINNCENSGNVYSIEGQNAAGIIGGVGQLTECIINSSKNLSSIIANTYSAGGIIGQIQDGGKSTITESYNTGEIKTKVNGRAGGIVGGTITASTLNIDKAYNTGKVTSAEYSAGGIVGISYNNSTVEISNSYNAGEIGVGNASYGGILGNIDNSATGKISYCHNVGTLSGSQPNKGTMVGYQNGKYTGTKNYWLETCNAIYSVGSNSTIGNKYTTNQMKVESNFDGWNFDTIWKIDENKGYPVLK